MVLILVFTEEIVPLILSKDFSILILLARIFLEFFKLSTFKVPPTLILSVLLISLALKFSLTTIFPVLLRVVKLIFSLISPPLFKRVPFTFNFFSVATAPVLFKLLTLIFSFAINVLLDTTSFAMKFLFVNISPSLFTFPFIEILSKLFTFPLFFKLFATSIFKFACILPLLFKEPSTFKISPVKIFSVFSKFLTLISLFAFNSFVFFKSLELNFELVKILPLLLAFSEIFISSMA